MKIFLISAYKPLALLRSDKLVEKIQTKVIMVQP